MAAKNSGATGNDVDAIRTRTSRPLGLAEWLSISQLIALIVGACWTGFLFVKFDSREKLLEREKTELELRKLKASPIRFEQDVAVWKYNEKSETTKEHLGIDYQYAITNTTGQKLKIALVVVHAFLLPPLTDTTAETVEVPSIDLSKDSIWRRVASRAHLADGEDLPGGVVTSSQGDTFKATRGGGGTGLMEPGDTNRATLSLIVRGPSSDFIGFMVDAFVRLEDGTERWVSSTRHARLSMAGSARTFLGPDTSSSRSQKQ